MFYGRQCDVGTSSAEQDTSHARCSAETRLKEDPSTAFATFGFVGTVGWC